MKGILGVVAGVLASNGAFDLGFDKTTMPKPFLVTPALTDEEKIKRAQQKRQRKAAKLK